MVNSSQLETLATTLFDIGAVKIGRFKLHSGRTSRIYLDLRLLVSYPEALRLVSAAYRPVLDELTYDLLAGTPYAGLPIATALCLDTDKPMIYPRKSAKSYGTGKGVEGTFAVGQTAVIIDDLITSGDSILQAIASLKSVGLQINEAVVLIDREQGGVEALTAAGYQLRSVMTLRHLLAILESTDRISSKKRAKVLKSLY